MAKTVDVINSRIGRIKVFDADRGFGFISALDDSSEYFVHISRISGGAPESSTFVVFDLAPSRKKPGTSEAIGVLPISMVRDNSDFLLENYFRFRDEGFQSEVLNALPTGNLEKLIRREIDHVKELNDPLRAKKILAFVDKYKEAIIAGDKTSAALKTLSEWATEHSSNAGKVLLWIDGQLEINLDNSVVFDAFFETDREKRLKIYSKVEDTIRDQITSQMIKSMAPKDVLSFITDHIYTVNKLRSLPSNKAESSKDGLIGSELLAKTIVHYEHVLADIEKIGFCFEGYRFAFPIGYLFENLHGLGQKEVSKLLSGNLLKKELIERFTSEIIQIYSADAEYLKWFYHEVENKFSTTEFESFRETLLSNISNATLIALWKDRVIIDISKDQLKQYLGATPSAEEIKQWLQKELISENDIGALLSDRVKTFGKIESRKRFYAFHALLTTLRDLRVAETELQNISGSTNSPFCLLSRWIAEPTDSIYDNFKNLFLFLNHQHQIWFIKCAFAHFHKQRLCPDVSELINLLKQRPPILDEDEIAVNVTLSVVIYAIEKLKSTGHFLIDYDLIYIALGAVSSRQTYRLEIDDLFERCPGRTAPEYNWKTSGTISKIPFGAGQFYFAVNIPTTVTSRSRSGEHEIRNPHFEHLKERAKEIPGRKWNAEQNHWGVPASKEEYILKFAKANRMFLDFDRNHITNNPHLAEFKVSDIPKGITFCEGRKSNLSDMAFNKEFWWCCNKPCFQNSETSHSFADWQNYTLLDFLKIMGFELSDTDTSGQFVEKSIYYKFISSLNRFKRLLERMYCHQCGHILHPTKEANFTHYRVVRFSCQNSLCREHSHEVYLHHCLNGKCNGIIDSRISKKCPNGLYICADKDCGRCCSNEMFERRKDNLSKTGGKPQENLEMLISSKAGHFEKRERYCHKCGRRMTMNGNELHCGCG